MILNSKSTAVFAGDYTIGMKFQRRPARVCGVGELNGAKNVRCNDVETGSEILKISAAKPDLLVSQLIYKMAKKVQRLSTCFL